MVIVTGTIAINPKQLDAAIAQAITVMEATRLEAGCIVYAISQDLQDPNLFRVYEEWESQAYLDIHLQSAHITELNRVMPELIAREPEIKFYGTAPA